MAELIIKKGKMKIYGQLFMPSVHKKTYPLVILCHGYTADHTHSEIYAKDLNKIGVAAYAFDFCGGGPTSKSDGAMVEMSVLTEVQDVEAILDYFRSREDFDSASIFLLGQSQGGFVSALVGAQREEQIAGLILAYPAFVIPDDARKRFPEGMVIPKRVDQFGCIIGKRYYEDVIGMDAYEEIAGFHKDVLIIHGDKDAIVPIDYSRRAKKVYDHATLMTIKGAGHGFDGAEARKAIEAAVRFVEAELSRKNKWER